MPLCGKIATHTPVSLLKLLIGGRSRRHIQMVVTVDVKKLLEAGAHFGHQSRRWNPKMAPYLYGIQDGVHVFDLIKTKKLLVEALKVLRDSAKGRKAILIVGTKKQAKDKVREVAQATGCFFVNERWLGGTLTNFDQIKKSTKKLSDMKKKMDAGEYKQFTKKERLLAEREIARLERFFGGVAGMENLPDVMVIIDTKRGIGAAKEARSKGIEIVGIVDSNSDPTLVDYPIPMNDDATKALDYVLSLVRDAILEGKKLGKGRKSSTSSKGRTGK